MLSNITNFIDLGLIMIMGSFLMVGGIVLAWAVWPKKRIQYKCEHCNYKTKVKEELGYHLEGCDDYNRWRLKTIQKESPPKQDPSKKPSKKSDEKYLYILKKRLANGEITLEEYNDLKEEFE